MNINEQCLLKFLKEPNELSDLTILLKELIRGIENTTKTVLVQEGY